MVRAIEELHSVTVFITLTAAITNGPGGFTTVCARHEAKRGQASVLGEPVIVLSGEWPCKDHKDYASCVYASLYELDSQLSAKLWHQLSLALPDVPPGA